MKWLLAIVMVLHGIIHSIGGIEEFGFANIQGFSGKTLFPLPGALQIILGAGWFAAVILFILSAIMLLAGSGSWKTVAIISIFFSQFLIVLWWPDAKWGTLPLSLIHI